jgi:5-methylcytosine-specific restriction protein A
MSNQLKWHKTSRHQRGYGSHWDKLRKVVLDRDMHMCQSCLSRDRATVANQVDHIKPRSKGGTDDLNNLQALCKPCHDAKTITDNGGKLHQAIGLDGWPLD